MNRTLIKVGSRVAVVILIYLLLSIPDSRYQSELEDLPTNSNPADAGYHQIVTHIPWVIGLAEGKVIEIYDSLNEKIGTRLDLLKSEMLSPFDLVLDSVNNDFGQITALIALTASDPKMTLDQLWQWKKFIKEQSLFWNLADKQNQTRIISLINFIGLCEDFIIVNRELSYAKFLNNPIDLNPGSVESFIRSGDLLVSSLDVSYPYLSLSKNGLQKTQSLGLILINDDSSFYVTATPSQGLFLSSFNELLVKPYSRRYILRLRSDLPELISNPTLAHQAAFFAFDLARRRTVDYDYNYNADSHSTIYETELLDIAYEGRNMDFSLSFTSIIDDCRFGINKLGISYTNQSVPNELQFHPSFNIVGQQLSGEAIWIRDLEMAAALAGFKSLKKVNAKSLRWRLPYYRLLKAYGNIVQLFGWEGQIPGGMSSETAIIHDYSLAQKNKIHPLLEIKVKDFLAKHHYRPTYPELCLLADEILIN